MLCNTLFSKAQKDKFALDIYQLLRPFAGRRGFEVRRTSGSSGKISPDTDKNLSYFLSYNEAILPHLARGCVILRADDRYLFCYAKVTPSAVDQHVVWDYTPPREGGQFNMPNYCIASFPPVAEMIYLKTLSILILNALNEFWAEAGLRPVANGPLKYENESLTIAREAFKQSPKDVAMYHFLSKFNSFNHYSMVAYPVGLNYDHFKHGKQSLENKRLFCLNPNLRTSIGRGGCIVGKSFVYALLDW